MVISLSFRECRASFTALSFSTVIVNTACLTKQFLSMSAVFSMCPVLFSFSISLPTAGCRCIGIGLPFCCIIFPSGFSWIPLLFLFVFVE